MFLKCFSLFLCSFYFLMFSAFNVVFLFLLKHKRTKLEYDIFLVGKLRSAVCDLYIQYFPGFSLYKW